MGWRPPDAGTAPASRSVDGRGLRTTLAVFEYIEGWYNPHRRHSALDYESPINFERRHRVAA